jgi:hypothetical protein
MPKLIRLIVPFCLSLIIGLLFLPCSASAAFFQDLEGHWSQEVVYKAFVLDLISGYPDGTFRPEEELSQVEAIVLFMRAAGYDLDNNKMRASTSGIAGVNFPQLSWGTEYIQQAVVDNLIEEKWLASFAGERPVNRAQIADLISRLFQLPLNQLNSFDEPFNDLLQAAPELRAAIIAVAQYDIIEGFENGSFCPNSNLKRGQAAAILAKLIDHRWLNQLENRQVEGWVQKVDFTGSPPYVELQSLQGINKYQLSPEVKCFKEGQECPFQQALYWRTKLYLDSRKQIGYMALLEKKSQGQEVKLTGTVRAVALGEASYLTLIDLAGIERIIPLSWSAELDVMGKNNAKGFQNLKPNSFVDVYLINNQVNRVMVLDTKSLSGTVKNIEGKRIYLENRGTYKPQWFNYWDRARIVDKDGYSYNLKRGDKIKVIYIDPDPDGIDDEIPLEIIVTSRPEWKKVRGEVERVINGTGERQLVLKKSKYFTLDANAKVHCQDGSALDFSLLLPGDRVELMQDGAGIIMELILIEN